MNNQASLFLGQRESALISVCLLVVGLALERADLCVFVMLPARRQRCQRPSIRIASGGLYKYEARKVLERVKFCRRFASENSRFLLFSEDFEASNGDAMLTSDENGFLSGLCVEC